MEALVYKYNEMSW